MLRNGRGIRRALAAPLSALTLFVGAVGPLLDRVEPHAGAELESRHHPESCAPAHDHMLCLQVGANQALPSVACVPTVRVAVRVRALPPVLETLVPSVKADGPFARGPPLA